MASEQKAIGFEGMTIDEAKNFMDNLNARYLGSVETNGFEFHEWYSDFNGNYTWAVVGDDKVAFGGESKSGMLEANEGSATEAQLEEPSKPEEPAPPTPEEIAAEKEEAEKVDYVEIAVPDSAIAPPNFVDSRDKDFMKARQKDREKENK